MQLILEQNPLFFVGLATIVSLIVGSFLNVVIHRLPLIMQAQLEAEVNQTEPPKYNLAFPNSECPKCKTPIKPWQNIPVISWLLLGAKCASCKKPIHWRYPLVELSAGVLGFAISLTLGATTESYFLMIASWALITLIAIDIDCYLLPDSITLPLLWLGLIANSFGLFTDLQSAVWGAIVGYLILWLVYWLFKLTTGKEGMGYGDFKLLAAIGAWLGWQALPMTILISAFVGAALGGLAILVAGRDKAKPIPFGPYLGIAAMIVFIWGDTLNQIISP